LRIRRPHRFPGNGKRALVWTIHEHDWHMLQMVIGAGRPDNPIHERHHPTGRQDPNDRVQERVGKDQRTGRLHNLPAADQTPATNDLACVQRVPHRSVKNILSLEENSDGQKWNEEHETHEDHHVAGNNRADGQHDSNNEQRQTWRDDFSHRHFAPLVIYDWHYYTGLEVDMTPLIIAALSVVGVLLIVIGFLRWRNQSHRPTMHLEEALLQSATRQMHAAAHDPHTMSSLQELAHDVSRALASPLRSYGYASYVAVRHALLVVSVFDPKGRRQKQEFVKDFASSIDRIVHTAGNNRGLTVGSLQRHSFSSKFMAVVVYRVQTTTAKPGDPTSAARVPPFSSRRDTPPYDEQHSDMPGTDHGESRRNVRPTRNGDDLFNVLFSTQPDRPRS